jgi:hypothetical protein
MIAGIPILIENGINWLPVLFIFPIINILLLVGVASYTQSAHKYVAFFTIFSLLRSSKEFIGQPIDIFMVVDLILIAGLIGLGFYLNAKLCPDYSIIKERYQNNQGQDRLRYVIKFND